MDDAYIGSIVMFAGDFAPVGWALCNGQLIPVSQNPSLFSIIGTTYGGDGINTFGLPDLRGRVPVHAGSGHGLTHRVRGDISGDEWVALSSNQMPAHTHSGHAIIRVNEEANTDQPDGNYIAGNGDQMFATGRNTNLNAQSVELSLNDAGSNHGHNNMQPFLCVNFIICLQGLYPPRP